MSTPRVRLKELCEVITKGTTPTSIGLDYSDNGIGFLRVQNVSGGRVNFEQDTLFINAQVHQELRRSQILPGDVLLSIAGTIGRTGVVPKNAPPLNCNQAVAIVRPTDKVFRSYLRHWLESNDAQSKMRGSTVTGTIQNLSLAQVGSLQVPLPPLPEQIRIAAILDQADALRVKRREALAQLDSLTQAIFIEMFGDPVTNPKGWAVKPFESQIESVRYGTGSPPPYSEEGLPFIRATNIKGGTISTKDLKRISPSEAKKLDKCKVHYGNLIVVRSGVNTGDCAMIPHEYAGAYAAFDLIVDIEPINGNFYSYLINSAYGQLVLAPLTRRAAQPHLNAEQLRTLEFIVPPSHLKDEFANCVSSINRLKEVHKASLAELDNLFASLQHRAFRGEL